MAAGLVAWQVFKGCAWLPMLAGTQL